MINPVNEVNTQLWPMHQHSSRPEPATQESGIQPQAFVLPGGGWQKLVNRQVGDEFVPSRGKMEKVEDNAECFSQSEIP